MISIGLSEEERRVLRDIIGNLDPKDNITVSKFSADEYLVELFPSEGEIITAHREEKPPLKIKPFPCLDFDEVCAAMQEVKKIISR